MEYLKEIKTFIGDSVKYDEWGGGYLWGVDNKGINMIAEVESPDEPDMIKDGISPVVSIRGWGAIQHLFKTHKEAKAFQDELGMFIQDAINEKLKQL